MLGFHKMDLVCEVHDGCDLLPIYCADCDCPLCSDCVTRDHVGHKFRKVSEVAETQLRQLEESLSHENSILRLKKLLTDAERRQKNLLEHRERLLRNVVEREEEIMEKVRVWREQMTESILKLAEKQQKSLNKDVALMSALLQCKEKGLYVGIEYDGIQIFLLNHGLMNLISDKNARRYGIQILENQDFRIGMASDNLFDLFGKLLDETEEMSSDTYQEEGENVNWEEHDDDIFYDSLDLKMVMKFKFRSDSVVNIVPLEISKTLFLIKETVFVCDVKKRGLNPQLILSNVLQICLIPCCGDVLLLMKDRKCIKRISSGKLVTTYAKTNNVNDLYYGVGPAGKQAYACLAHDMNTNEWGFVKLSLLDEFGRILMSLSFPTITCIYSTCHLVFCSDERNKFFRIYKDKVYLENIKNGKIETIKSYDGSLGTSPLCAFIPKDIAIDNLGNLLVAVPNDNAIHLLDKTLTFQKLLMMEEDGLQRPTSVALDDEGYLYVGCDDGQIHVMNYQYLLNTNRLTRLKIEQLR